MTQKQNRRRLSEPRTISLAVQHRTLRDHQRYQGKSTMRPTFRKIHTMRHKIRTFGEMPKYRHYRQIRRRSTASFSESDTTPTRTRRALTLSACRTDTAHRGPAHGASLEAARSANSARIEHRVQNTLVPLIRPAIPALPHPGFGVSPRGAHRAHPNLSTRTAPSAHLSCGANQRPRTFQIGSGQPV